MFVLRCRPLRHKRLFFSLAAVSAAVALCCTVLAICCHDTPADSAEAGEKRYSTVVKNGDYRAFLAQLGIDAENKPTKEKTVTIPDEFNQTYERYNALQQSAGLNLARYSGKTARQLTFPVHGGMAAYAVLLVRDGRVIGGHLTNGEYGSEMLPLTAYGTTG